MMAILRMTNQQQHHQEITDRIERCPDSEVIALDNQQLVWFDPCAYQPCRLKQVATRPEPNWTVILIHVFWETMFWSLKTLKDPLKFLVTSLQMAQGSAKQKLEQLDVKTREMEVCIILLCAKQFPCPDCKTTCYAQCNLAWMMFWWMNSSNSSHQSRQKRCMPRRLYQRN